MSRRFPVGVRTAPACALVAVAIFLVGAGNAPPPAPEPGPVLLDLNPPLLAAPQNAPTQPDPAEAKPAQSQPPAAAGAPGADAVRDAMKKALAPSGEGAPPAPADRDVQPSREQSAASPPEPPQRTPRPPLSPELTALRDALRQRVAAYAQQPFNTRDNTPANVMHVCLAFGCEGEVRRAGESGGPINSVTCLCWNYPCAGYKLLRTVDGRIAPEIGYGLQEHPGQFLAALALARVPREYPIRAGEKVGAVDDLVAWEKLSCRGGADLSLKLIGLARYVPTDATWSNDLGEQWSIARMIQEELTRSGDTAPDGGTHRLLALSYAVDRRLKQGKPLDGPFARAKAYVEEFQKYVLELQNPDGTWHPGFFAYRGQGGTTVEQLRSTGHVLRWLAFSLPEDRLRDPAIVRSVARLVQLLGDRRGTNTNLPGASAREIAARLGAVHALAIYDQRVFRPYDRMEAETAPEDDADATPAPTVSRMAPRR
ncbi:MAG: hypothetical protein JW809_08395 [Pirellulales bacterium]|nr:hypothetical protein [Pirellulales bacterium]